MLTATLLLLGAVLVGMGLVERHVTRLPLSTASVYLVVGWLAGFMAHDLPVSPTDPRRADLLVILSETAVLVSLFAVGLNLRVPLTIKGWRIALGLATTGMVVTVILATLTGMWLLPELGFAGALLLAGILAPTDPVLASEVQIRSAHDRDAVRVALTAEGGLNDATALPAVMLALGLLGAVPLGHWGLYWLWHDLAWPIAGGALLGWLFGRGMGYVVHELLRRGHGLCWDELLYMGLVMLAYGISRLTDTSSFLFVFAAGLGVFRLPEKTSQRLYRDGVDGDALARRLLEFGHRIERLAEVAMVLMMGFALAWTAWHWQALLYGALLLFVVRPLAVLACVRGLHLPAPQRRMMAWFGVRGVGSLFYLAVAADAGLAPALSARLVEATLPAIALSVILHGVSATPLMALYRRRSVMRKRRERLEQRRSGSLRSAPTRGAGP